MIAKRDLNEQSLRVVKLAEIFLTTLPEHLCAFLYGSSAFSQQQSINQLNHNQQIDLLIITNNPARFHSRNFILNPSHYKDYHLLTSEFSKTPPLIYLPYIKSSKGCKEFFKIGVVDFKEAVNDIKNWTSFIIAPRLQKPTIFIPSKLPVQLQQKGTIQSIAMSQIKAIEDSVVINFKSALIAAILLHPFSPISHHCLYECICSLSYRADLRMLLFEDPKKVSNIVTNQLKYFDIIYKPYILELEKEKIIKIHDDYITLNLCRKTIFQLMRKLPANMSEKLYQDLLKNFNQYHDQDTMYLSAANHLEKIEKCVKFYFKNKSFKASWMLVIYNLQSLSWKQIAKYLWQKMKKRIG